MNLFRQALALILILTAGSLARAQSTIAANENGMIIERSAYSFVSYDEAVKTTDVEIYADNAAYDQAVGDVNFEFQKLKYFSDGLKVTAYLFKPKRIDGPKLPTIIFNRGSAVRETLRRNSSRSFIVWGLQVSWYWLPCCGKAMAARAETNWEAQI